MLLSIDRYESCDVVQENLRSVLDRIDSVPESVRDYIKTLASQPPRVVLRAQVPIPLIEELQKAMILRCKFSDPRHPDQTDLRYNNIIILSTAVSISKPSSYIFKPSCTIAYQGSKITVRLLKNYKATDSGNRENKIDEPLAIKESGSFVLVYDPLNVGEMTKEKFARLVKNIVDQEVEVTAECSVFFTNKEIPIVSRKKFTPQSS